MKAKMLIAAAASMLTWACGAQALTVLGTGTGALQGSDLTDVGDDGVEANYVGAGNLGGFDGIFFSSSESNFSPVPTSNEGAFNVFDNRVGGGQDKWCCGSGPGTPQIVGVRGLAPVPLTHFTVASANDTPTRDPRIWRIEGSNNTTTGLDGSWTTIYANNSGVSDWGNTRLQVNRYSPSDGDTFLSNQAFSAFRMVTDQTGLNSGAFFQVAEIEFFSGAIPAPPAEAWNNTMVRISNALGVTDTQINNTNEARGIFAAASALPTGSTGSIGANGQTYNIATLARNNTVGVNMGGGNGNFTPNDPYPDGTTTTNLSDFLVHSQTFAKLQPGVYTIAAGSDDGRVLELDTVSGPNDVLFTATSGQVDGGSGVGTNFLLRNGTTGHNRSIGTFVINGETILDIQGLFFERGGGDSWEISIARGQVLNFNTTDFRILADGVFGIELSPNGFVPEPATGLLALMAIAGLGRRRRRAA